MQSEAGFNRLLSPTAAAAEREELHSQSTVSLCNAASEACEQRIKAPENGIDGNRTAEQEERGLAVLIDRRQSLVELNNKPPGEEERRVHDDSRINLPSRAFSFARA